MTSVQTCAIGGAVGTGAFNTSIAIAPTRRAPPGKSSSCRSFCARSAASQPRPAGTGTRLLSAIPPKIKASVPLSSRLAVTSAIVMSARGVDMSRLHRPTVPAMATPARLQVHTVCQWSASVAT